MHKGLKMPVPCVPIKKCKILIYNILHKMVFPVFQLHKVEHLLLFNRNGGVSTGYLACCK